jgi:hypothetical protein
MTDPVVKWSTNVYLDEMLSILRSMEATQEQIDETMNCLLWQGMPFWRRWAARWRNARAVIDLTEQEGQDEPPTMLFE